jgi:hypothetical protein
MNVVRIANVVDELGSITQTMPYKVMSVWSPTVIITASAGSPFLSMAKLFRPLRARPPVRMPVSLWKSASTSLGYLGVTFTFECHDIVVCGTD